MEDVKGHIKRVEISVSAIARNLANQSVPSTYSKDSPPKPAITPAKTGMEETVTGISAQPLTE
ncbi:MAG: hypothetical protein CSB28_00295 [Desulfobacterales bacterium]|nr:MAG: hypothetical protein CSB28_00295 [Desulfobacterales bacterium]